LLGWLKALVSLWWDRAERSRTSHPADVPGQLRAWL